MHWKNHFFTADFTDAADFLSSKPAGYIFSGAEAESLCAILKEHDHRKRSKKEWTVADRDCDFNLLGAKVDYNGKNSSSFRTNSKFSHVLVLKFDEGECCPHGKLYLQYNREA